MVFWDELDEQLIRRALERLPKGEPSPTPRRAAVAALLSPGPRGVRLLLIRRAVRAGDPWSGHIALPGGYARGDEPDLDAALRETLEEIGVDLTREARLLGALDALTPHRTAAVTVRPFIFAWNGKVAFERNLEVEELLWANLSELASGASDIEYEVELGGQRARFPAWSVDGHVVWGLTYRVVKNLMEQVDTARTSVYAEE
jgi:8-oxo-dGTP pyrophosphatase MutT (NUDIX family)